MKAISPDSIKQEGDSCYVAITGIAYTLESEGLKSKNINLKSLVANLSRTALKDDDYDYPSSSDKNISVIFCDHLKSSLSSSSAGKKRDLFSPSELSDYFGFSEQSMYYEKPISNSLQGLKIGADRLQNSNCDAVLLILADSDLMTDLDHGVQTSFSAVDKEPNILTTNSKNNCYLAVFILRRLNTAIENKKRIYASLALICETNEDAAGGEIQACYEQAGITTRSINLLALTTKSSSINSEIVKLSRWFLGNSNYINKDESKGQIRNLAREPWCSFRTDQDNNSNRTGNTISLLLETVFAIQQRILLPLAATDIIETIDFKHTPFYLNSALRPWFHPQIHPQLRQMSPQTNYSPSLRCAAMHVVEDNGQTYHIVAKEYEDINESKQKDLQPDWPSEIFTFAAHNRFQLAQYLEALVNSLSLLATQPELKDLAFTINNRSIELINKELFGHRNAEKITAAFVCSTLQEFFQKVTDVINICLDETAPMKSSDGFNENQGIYWHIGLDNEPAQNKLAFVLPGLGAAYPNMLAELCLHFPEVRAIFDFVDEISVLAGDRIRPSDRIFARIDPYTKSFRETPASLAVMDSAVVTVLMAEWAIFTLLLNLGIVPDILLGCSTGEFAALTMSGAIDIMRSAPLFYHLSTGIVRALPINKLVNLRSLKINASLVDIQSQLKEFDGKVHLSADLSSSQLIVTGDKDSINSLAKIFEGENISADFLPFAIPYHTTLVSGVVSADNPDIEALQISKPLIESWSCSLAKQYPSSPEKIKKMTTELFSKPILLKDSIEALYADGVRLFVEVGPRGSLAPMVSETLKSDPHISLAANLADRPAITQLQNILAALFVNNVCMDLSYLYGRRSPTLLPIKEEPIILLHRTDTPPSITRQYEQSESKTTAQVLEPLAVPTLLEVTTSFQTQLLQLEREVISHLLPDNLSANINCLSKEIAIAQTFTALKEEKYKTIVCRHLLEARLPADEKALSSFANSILTPFENEVFHSFRQISKRKEWLSGRIAAKEAIKILWQNMNNEKLTNTDIEINSLPSGKPYIAKIGQSINKTHPLISITHKNGVALAVVADNKIFSKIGIDIESNYLEDNDLEELILTTKEREHIQHLSGETKACAIKKIWSAKEAVAKLLGIASLEWLTKLSLHSIDHNRDQILIRTNNDIDEVPHGHLKDFTVHIAQVEEAILALTVI